MFIRKPFFEEEHFFNILQKNISSQDLHDVERKLAPAKLLDSACTLETLFSPLTYKKFPRASALDAIERFELAYNRMLAGKDSVSHIGNYKWCIEEFIGFDGLKVLLVWNMVYLIALHTYCDRIEPNIENSSLLSLLVDTEIASGGTICADIFADFLEWLIDESPKSIDYNDYYVMSAWMSLRSLRGTATKDQLDVVKKEMEKLSPCQ